MNMERPGNEYRYKTPSMNDFRTVIAHNMKEAKWAVAQRLCSYANDARLPRGTIFERVESQKP